MCGDAQIKFEAGILQTPELLQDIEIPEAVTVLGQSLDLTAVKSALQPVTSSLRTAVAQACHGLPFRSRIVFMAKSGAE